MSKSSDLFSMRDLIAVGLTFLLTLLFFFFKNTIKQLMDTFTAKMETIAERVTGITRDVDDNKAALKELSKGFAELKSTVNHGDDRAFRDLSERIEKVNGEIRNLEVKFASKGVRRDECRASLKEVQNEMGGLESKIKEIDQLSRKQEVLLARIDSIIQALIDA